MKKKIAHLLIGICFLASACAHRMYLNQKRDTLSSSILQTAVSLQGSPYRYGGSTPQGFDCAGFIQYVFKAHGIALPRVCQKQAHAGRKILFKKLLPGDLVFFHTRGMFPKATHVGLYIGDAKFIHAGTSEPSEVRVDGINSPYYKPRFLYGRRVY